MHMYFFHCDNEYLHVHGVEFVSWHKGNHAEYWIDGKEY